MSGGIGSVVRLQTPCSSFCIGICFPPIDTATSLAFGARRRNVTRPSVAISGDFTGGTPRPPRPAGAAACGAAGVGAAGCRAVRRDENALAGTSVRQRRQSRLIEEFMGFNQLLAVNLQGKRENGKGKKVPARLLPEAKQLAVLRTDHDTAVGDGRRRRQRTTGLELLNDAAVGCVEHIKFS